MILMYAKSFSEVKSKTDIYPYCRVVDDTAHFLFSCVSYQELRRSGKWSLGLMPFGLKSFGLIQLVTWPNFFKLSVSGIGHMA